MFMSAIFQPQPPIKLTEALQNAIRNNDLEGIRLGLESVSIDQRQQTLLGPPSIPTDERTRTLQACLAEAMDHSALASIKFLFGLGSRLTSRSMWNVVGRGDITVLQSLIDAGWNINSTQVRYAAIHMAIDDESMLRWVLEHGADPNTLSEYYPGDHPHTALADAAELATADSLNLLLAHGAKDYRAIFHAIGMCGRQRNGTATLQALINHGVDVNYPSRRWGTPLRQAVRVMNEDKFKVLLDHGADPHCKGAGYHMSAFDLAKDGNLTHYVAMMESASGQLGP